MSQKRAAQSVAGTVVVAFLLAGSRWASHLGVHPFFVTDLLISLAFLHYAASFATGVGRDVAGRRSAVERLVWLLIAWATFRMAVAPEPLAVTALRDFAPYLYAAMALLGAWSVRRATAAVLERTRRILMGALYFHAAWYTLVALLPEWAASLPGGIFEGRPDVDTALNSVLAALLLFRVATGRTRRPGGALLVSAYSLLGVLTSDTRAGLVATVTVVGFSGAVAITSSSRRRSLGVLAALPALLATALLVLPFTDLGQRVQDTFATDAVTTTARGTTHARLNSWGHLYDWVTSERAITGVGFGPNFMTESGAIVRLVGTGDEAEAVRSPHNYWLGTLARLGWVGVILAALISAAAVRTIWARRRVAAEDELRLLLSLVVLGILPIATVGVVLESPFGAVPFWWALGAVLALSAHDPPEHDRGVRAAR